MAKTTRKTDSPNTEPKARPVRRKTAVAGKAAKALSEPTASAEAKGDATTAPAPVAARPARTRTTTAAPGPRTARKASTGAEAPAVAADRPAAAPAPAFSDPTHDEIAVRAYHIYLRRNGWPGSPDRDWLQAIEELRAERRARATR